MKNIDAIKEYVYKNYKMYKNKDLIVTEHDNHYSVREHRDGSPLVLSKDIVYDKWYNHNWNANVRCDVCDCNYN